MTLDKIVNMILLIGPSKNDITEEHEVEVKKSATELQQPTASEHDTGKSSEVKKEK